MTIDRIDLKERIAISDAYTPEERTFILLAINNMPEMEIECSSPRNYMGRIEQIWAWLSVDDGGEGVCAAPLQPGQLSVPLIAADKKRLEALRPFAVACAKVFNKPVRLVRFWQREDREIIRP